MTLLYEWVLYICVLKVSKLIERSKDPNCVACSILVQSILMVYPWDWCPSEEKKNNFLFCIYSTRIVLEAFGEIFTVRRFHGKSSKVKTLPTFHHFTLLVLLTNHSVKHPFRILTYINFFIELQGCEDRDTMVFVFWWIQHHSQRKIVSPKPIVFSPIYLTLSGFRMC